MKLFLLLFITLCMGACFGPKKYNCEYKETLNFPMPESVLQRMKKQIEDQGFSSNMADQLLQQISLQNISAGYSRIIEARSDSTFILMTNKEEGNEAEGEVKMNMRIRNICIVGIKYMFLILPPLNLNPILPAQSSEHSVQMAVRELLWVVPAFAMQVQTAFAVSG